MSHSPFTPSTVCIFCASSASVDLQIVRDGCETARLLAQAGLGLVYGGTTCGLMKTVADEFRAAGGRVIGVVPEFMVDQGIAHPALDELVKSKTMADRKAMMNERSGAFLVLPGGIGTMDELFDTLAQKQLGIHHKPIVLLNTLNYYQPLRDFLNAAVGHSTIRPEHLSLIAFADTPQEAAKLITSS
jgi:hypothetical protein